MWKVERNGYTEWLNDKGERHRDDDLPAVEEANGSKKWYKNGKLHREGGLLPSGAREALPAIEDTDGTKQWWVNGMRHREGDLPAVEYASGTKEWWVNGLQHREGDLPAAEQYDGSKAWYKNGKRHRDGGLPAIEWNDGSKSWWVNGKRHRDDGLPAVELVDGTKEWWINDVPYHPDRWTVEPKTNDMEGKICVITMEPIQNDSEVGKCGVCSALTLFSAISEWLGANETCPHCRSKWTNWVKYVN